MKDNKLIAEFMGAVGTPKYNPTEWDVYITGCLDVDSDDENAQHFYTPDEMKYHTSWDWLMPVVERINDTERYEVCIGNCHCHITDIENDNYKIRALTLSLQGKTTIEATHLAVVEFINWYNRTTDYNKVTYYDEQ